MSYINTAIKRSRIKRHAPKRRSGDSDPAYKAWIRTLPCVACFLKLWGWEQIFSMSEPGVIMSESAHVGRRGLSQLAPDRTCIPLCGFEHHREGRESHHKLQKKFWETHGLDRDALIAELNARYDAQSL